MSLKSGLVSECTWAIDTLNILLADNNTITYFHLKQLPGLLDTLMDHYRRSMGNLFEDFSFTEIPLSATTETKDESGSIDKKLTDLWVGVCKNAKSSYTSNIASNAIVGGMKETLNSGREYWQEGGGDYTQHIQTAFPNRDFTIQAFPKGIPVVTKTEEAKKRKLDEQRERTNNTVEHTNDKISKENNRIVKSPTPNRPYLSSMSNDLMVMNARHSIIAAGLGGFQEIGQPPSSCCFSAKVVKCVSMVSASNRL